MKVIKKFALINLETSKINRTITINLNFGEITGGYYDENYPKEEFDTEDEAIEHAYNNCKYSRYLILPLIRFEN